MYDYILHASRHPSHSGLWWMRSRNSDEQFRVLDRLVMKSDTDQCEVVCYRVERVTSVWRLHGLPPLRFTPVVFITTASDLQEVPVF